MFAFEQIKRVNTTEATQKTSFYINNIKVSVPLVLGLKSVTMLEITVAPPK